MNTHSASEYPARYFASPRGGMTTVDAVRFLKNEYPHIVFWTSWTPQKHQVVVALQRMVPSANVEQGKVGNWSWCRKECSYPSLQYWTGFIDCQDQLETSWVGMLEIRGPDNESFLLFGYLDSLGQVGGHYFAATADLNVLRRFANDLEDLGPSFNQANQIMVHVLGGKNYKISTTQTEPLILEEAVQTEIESQVFSFFGNAEAYRNMGIPYRRGFLFTGTPGNGKTLMLRHLIRRCHSQFRTTAIVLNSSRVTDEHDLESAFEYAAAHAPCMLLLEDLDSLVKESMLTRAGLLARLDGLSSRDGVLVLGTTNNPGDIDEALVHRPSRFDRVWHFRLPNLKLRVKYLNTHFPLLDEGWLYGIATETEGWSFAYLNELRVTAAIVSMNCNAAAVTEFALHEALQALATQFKLGKQRHTVDEPSDVVGFQSHNQ